MSSAANASLESALLTTSINKTREFVNIILMINSISYKFRGFEGLRVAERKGKSRENLPSPFPKANEAELT